jgi:acyl-CoA synthetase (AMP-forming)/AMP-acid ligase II
MLPIPQRLLGEALIKSAKENPQKTAIIANGKEYTFTDLFNRVKLFGEHLVRAGIKKGDRVAIYMNNSWESIISIYATSFAGGAFMVINPQTKSHKLQYILKDSGAKVLVSEIILKNNLIPALEEDTDVSELIVVGDSKKIQINENILITEFENAISKTYPEINFPDIIANDLAALIYTSGSTGFPKGVMMNHQNMVFTSWSLIEYLRLKTEDRIMLLIPLAFDYGLYQLIMSVTIGGTLIVEQSFIFPTSVYKDIELYKPTIFPGVPTIYAMMIASHKSSGIVFEGIQKITNTAAALPADFIPDLKKIFPNALIFKMYGQTESKRICYLEPELLDKKPKSVGKAIPGTEVFLLSPNGEPVPPGQPGILHVRGPHVMMGYWNKEDLSKKALRPGLYPYEKILHTNDWFTMDDEGFLYFQGRNDDIIKTRGEKVSPVEVENVIYNLQGIREVAVLGIPDPIISQSIVAFITKHESSELTEKEIFKECTTHLESFMVPQKVIFLDEMPKNLNGKIDKKRLNDILDIDA